MRADDDGEAALRARLTDCAAVTDVLAAGSGDIAGAPSLVAMTHPSRSRPWVLVGADARIRCDVGRSHVYRIVCPPLLSRVTS